MSVNKVIIVGFLGKDPEVKTIDSGKKVASFTLATSESYTNKQGEKVTDTEWHNCKAWGALAGVIEKYLKKGSQVYVEGKIKYRSYEKDGVTKYITEISVDSLHMLGSKGDSRPEQKSDPLDFP